MNPETNYNIKNQFELNRLKWLNYKRNKQFNKKLAESQDINKVDVISGATWSYNIFRASLTQALEKAR